MNNKSKEFEAQIPDQALAPPPPYSTAHGSQVLQVNYINWKRNIIVSGSDGQQLYSGQGSSCSSTRMEFMNRRNQVIGQTKRSNLTSKIDVEISGTNGTSRTFEMHNSASVLGGSPKFTSPAFGGSLIWKNTAMSSRIIYTLIDERGTALARFESDPDTRIGKLEITDAVAGEDKFNELVVTLLTLLQRKMKNIQAAWVAAVT